MAPGALPGICIRSDESVKLSGGSGQQESVPSSLAISSAANSSSLDVAQLYQEHSAFVGRILLRFLGEGTHVDDMLQETFIIAFEKRESFDPSRAAPSTWLYGIAANLCRHHKRSAGRQGAFRERLEREHSEIDAGPASSLERQQDIALVQEVVHSLPFKQREVFVLYEIEELSGKEIAGMLDIPLGTVWTRLHEARNGFRERMGRHAALHNNEQVQA